MSAGAQRGGGRLVQRRPAAPGSRDRPCRSSHTASTGWRSASATSQATRASWVFCLCLGTPLQRWVTCRQRHAEQGSHERHRLLQGQARRLQGALQPVEARLGGLVALKLQGARDGQSLDRGHCWYGMGNSETSATAGSRPRRSCSTSTRRDLPMPASPLSSTTCPRPSALCAQRASSSPSFARAHQGPEAPRCPAALCPTLRQELVHEHGLLHPLRVCSPGPGR